MERSQQENAGVPASGWRVVGASVRGTSHEKSGQPCQDAHLWRILPDNVLMLAVADGAGSASLAEIGAKVAVEAVVANLLAQQTIPLPQTDAEWQFRLQGVLKAALAAIVQEASVRKTSTRELASTLIVAVATPQMIAATQVGDGAVVLGDSAGNIMALTKPQCGEYLNETTFLISPGALDKPQTHLWRGQVAQVALFSDGLEMLALKMPEGTAHPPFFAPLFRFASEVGQEREATEELTSFLCSPRIKGRADDDLTLVLGAFI
jgi:hypothetical protein